MLPQVCGKPSTTCREHAPCSTVNRTGNTPQVCIMMSHPTWAFIHHTGCFGSCHTQIANHREQRFLCFRQITNQCRPVVHLGINVDGIFRIPWSILLVIPYTLQVCRLSTWLRRRNQQITSVLHHQRHKIQVTAIKCSQTFICLQVRIFRFRQSQRYAVVLLLILLQMALQ